MDYVVTGLAIWAVVATLGWIAARQDLAVARREIETLRAQRRAARQHP